MACLWDVVSGIACFGKCGARAILAMLFVQTATGLCGDDAASGSIDKGDFPCMPLTHRLFPTPKEYFEKGARPKALKYFAKSEPLKLLDYKIKDRTALVHIPRNYEEAGSNEWGLLVFISPHNTAADVVESFKPSLVKRKLLFAAPSDVGNERMIPLRIAVALDTLATMRAKYKFEQSRVYICGNAGGGPPAAMAALLYPEHFKGALSIAHGLPLDNITIDRKNTLHSMTPYLTQKDFKEIQKMKVRFVFADGDKDENHKAILLTASSWNRSGLDFRIFDVPWLSHHLPAPDDFTPILCDFLSWLDGNDVKGHEPRFEMYGIGSTSGPGKIKL